MENSLDAPDRYKSGLAFRLLGQLTVLHDGQPVALPPSRKVRALLGYLVLAPQPVGRERLCELLWDGPNDPRGELRWCLSRIRSLLGTADRDRLQAHGEMIAIDLGGSTVDALEVAQAAGSGIDDLDAGRLEHLAGLFAGPLLEGLQLDRSPAFDGWLAAQRRLHGDTRIALLRRLTAQNPSGSGGRLAAAEGWVAQAPFDPAAHVALLETLAARGRISEGDAHVAAMAGRFEDDGVSFGPVAAAWRRLRGRTTEPVPVAAPPEPEQQAVIEPGHPGEASLGRASLAVMPFRESGGDGRWPGALADGLTGDIITRLAKLRSIKVIARGSVYALAERGIGADEAGRRLGVAFVASGAIRVGERVSRISLELVEVETAHIVWADEFEQPTPALFDANDQIGNRIVTSIANEIETVERNRAVLRPPNSLDAWGACHRGLWHMYRFTRQDNAIAQHFLRMSIAKDPTFARAHAALSFTHWQNAFQHWEDVATERDLAYRCAGESLLADEQDPAAHWAMGRAIWLRGQHEEATAALERAVDISPNFALGYYALAFVSSQSGDPEAAIRHSDHSRRLSPYDPLLFGMLGTRAMSLVRLGRYDEAADWASRAAARPNAHANILAIAAHCLALAGRMDAARAEVARMRQAVPDYTTEHFLSVFQFAPEARAVFRSAGRTLGLL